MAVTTPVKNNLIGTLHYPAKNLDLAKILLDIKKTSHLANETNGNRICRFEMLDEVNRSLYNLWNNQAALKMKLKNSVLWVKIAALPQGKGGQGFLEFIEL